jgi:hypothetical protein
MPQILWTRYFLEAQGYTVTGSIIHQDNLSTMLLEKNISGSSSKRTWHINICHFFVANHIAAGEVKVKDCPTDEMLADFFTDFFTKPLQGSIFRKFRDFILNIQTNPNSTMCQDHRSVLSNHTNQKSYTTGNMKSTS